MKLLRILKMLVASAVLLAPGMALAWGASGHRLITEAAGEGLSPDLPAFLHSPDAIADMAEWSREPDRWRLAGTVHDSARDVQHFAYADDTGQLGGVVSFTALPPTRAAYALALRAAGIDPEAVGYLPYAIIDSWQQLAKDMVYWRADAAGIRLASVPAKREWLVGDQRRREAQLLLDAGLLAHYVGDATQPMHLSIHHDGWGDGANPDGFTTARVHVPYEGAYVAQTVSLAEVKLAMAAPRKLAVPVEAAVGQYLEGGSAQARAWYVLEKAGGFRVGDPRGAAFSVARLAAAASMLRDLINLAWASSASGQVNYPVAAVSDIETGKVDAYTVLRAPD